MLQNNWPDWKASEYDQLNQCHEQRMFGKPCQRPHHCDLLPLIWTCVLKLDGRKKARCVCDGSNRQQGAVTLGNAHAASLEQSGSRLFWALSALTGCKVYGADATNAFAEAPPPIAPLCVTIDDQYRDWYENHMNLGIAPPGSVLPVLQALQGHPESPRL